MVSFGLWLKDRKLCCQYSALSSGNSAHVCIKLWTKLTGVREPRVRRCDGTVSCWVVNILWCSWFKNITDVDYLTFTSLCYDSYQCYNKIWVCICWSVSLCSHFWRLKFEPRYYLLKPWTDNTMALSGWLRLGLVQQSSQGCCLDCFCALSSHSCLLCGCSWLLNRVYQISGDDR